MTQQTPIRDVVLRCRDCGQEASAREAHQQCQSFQCNFKVPGQPWRGWEIARITRAEAA